MQVPFRICVAGRSAGALPAPNDFRLELAILGREAQQLLELAGRWAHPRRRD